jgi:hypothetical protein
MATLVIAPIGQRDKTRVLDPGRALVGNVWPMARGAADA